MEPNEGSSKLILFTPSRMCELERRVHQIQGNTNEKKIQRNQSFPSSSDGIGF